MDEPTLREFYNEAVATLEKRNAEIERLRAALQQIADDDPCPARNIARAALTNQQSEGKKMITTFKVGDTIEWGEGREPHRWKVNGIHLGADGVESLIEVENVSHKPGWTGEWETHQMMFIPEVLLRRCRVVR